MLGCSDGKTTVSPTPPTIQISPALDFDFDFGTITEGNMASPLEVVITNVGSQELTVSDIVLSDTDNFQLVTINGTTPCTTTNPRLFTGESCTVEISFTPQSNTALATTLTITSDDPNATNKLLNLAGTSEQVDPNLTVTINQVDTTDTCDVTAYVSVTDQSNFPVEDLSAADFTITEGVTPIGSPTSADIVDLVTKPISIAVVMDNSPSMSDTDIAAMNQAALDVVLELKTGDEVEIIKFAPLVSVVQTFTSDVNLLTAAINTPHFGDGTALYDAIDQAILDTKNQVTERKAIIIITDGEDNSSVTATLNRIIDDAKAEGIPIFVIALGNFDQSIIDTVLEPIATGTSGVFYEADVAQNFSTIIKQQLTEILFVDQYILNYTSGSSGTGTVDLTIDVDNSAGLTGTGNKLVPSCP